MSILDEFKLEGRKALVTGCSRGIGFAMAQGLAEAGADIIGVSASLEESGSAIEKAVTDEGRSFSGYRCDFSDRAAVRPGSCRFARPTLRRPGTSPRDG